MLNRYARAFFTRVLTPTARFLLRIGVGPDTVTIIGTLGVCVSAILCFPRGWMLGGTLAVTAFIFSDLLDGTMARMADRVSKWGGFLDATRPSSARWPGTSPSTTRSGCSWPA
jgi:CDP-diacylglycerol--glycerol-3-phosphate 3-phosphatidyltransferase